MKKIINRTIRKIVYEKVSDFELEIPENNIYLFETGIRRSISVKPVWSTWNKDLNKEEEIYALEIVCVYLSYKREITYNKISISQIEEYLSIDNDVKMKELLTYIFIDVKNHNKRTQFQFIDDLNTAINTIKNSVYPTDNPSTIVNETL